MKAWFINLLYPLRRWFAFRIVEATPAQRDTLLRIYRRDDRHLTDACLEAEQLILKLDNEHRHYINARNAAPMPVIKRRKTEPQRGVMDWLFKWVP